MNLQSLNSLYVLELHTLYNAEQQILKALPRMIEAASSLELKQCLTEHKDDTQIHLNRLDEIFEMHAEKLKGERCLGMEAIIQEGQQLLKAHADSAVLDAALISAAQRVAHYEIAVYGCVRTWAEQLGFDRAAQVLALTLREEENADQTLTSIAKATVNIEAAHRAGS
jgi:ferritin-like metal-binding protein YciE